MKYYKVSFDISAPAVQMQDVCDLLSAFAGEIGFESFEETDSGLCGYIQQSLFDNARLDSMLEDFPISDIEINYSVCEMEDRDWNEVWEHEGFEPIVIGRELTIHDGRHLPSVGTPIMIEIDAKMAFGTGNHETTRMVVAALSDMDMCDKTLLDCGCGTGILGIAALKMGARQAVGYDIDDWSVDNSRHNAVINGLIDRYTSMLGDAGVITTLMQGKGQNMETGELLPTAYDVVVANINRNILLADMPSFVNAMKKGATLILSGFYVSDAEMLKSRASELGLVFIGERNDNDWACLTFEYRA